MVLVEEKEDAQNSTALKKKSLEVPTKADPNGFMKVHVGAPSVHTFFFCPSGPLPIGIDSHIFCQQVQKSQNKTSSSVMKGFVLK
jgi:hypothetical protein